ncbi:Conserved_hypothetical protein [Hexamita inflata]|uniref:Uncharacterized protein n=1 Tax=Hexamita inflata TaxID=28002 RepID=A0AA86PM02_9EUKA|nr:Conserved hypothetical protein [Hexamita inflata]
MKNARMVKKIIILDSDIYCTLECPSNHKATKQTVYGNYDECVPIQLFNSSVCEKWLNMKIWENATCDLTEFQGITYQINLSKWDNQENLNIQEFSNIDMGIINIKSLNNYSGVNYGFKPYGYKLTNGLFVVDVEIEITDESNIQFCVFQNVNNTMENVHVTGTIKITYQGFNNLHLSRMFGYILTSKSELSKFVNVSSSLKYIVNGVEITQDLQEIDSLPGVIIRLVNCLNETFMINPISVSLGTAKTVGQLILENKLFITDEILPSSKVQKIYTSFDSKQYPNLYQIYYTGALQSFQELYNQVFKLNVDRGIMIPFDKYDSFYADEECQQFIKIIVYITEYKAVVLMNNIYPIICTHGMLFDMIQKKCIDRSQCSKSMEKYIFLSLCLKEPIIGFQYYQTELENIICFDTCPIYLGYPAPEPDYENVYNNLCLQCSAGLKATYSSCETQCTNEYPIQFGNGCYDECPIGTVQQESTCAFPVSAADCGLLYFLEQENLSSRIMRNICIDYEAGIGQGLFVSQSAMNTFVSVCDGRVLLNQTCDQSKSIPCSENQNLKTVIRVFKNTQFCQLACINGDVNVSGFCQPKCEDMYSNYIIGQCQQCQDGFWNRQSNKCVKSCKYLNYTVSTICESDSELNETEQSIFCPQIIQKDSSSFWCKKFSCENLIQGSQCVKQCSSNYFVDESGTSCVQSCDLYQVNTILNVEQPQCVKWCQKFKYINAQYSDTIFGCFDSCSHGIPDRNSICVSDCKLFNQFPNPTVCEEIGNFCPAAIQINSTHQQCVQCEQFIQNNMCVDSCGPVPNGFVVQVMNGKTVKICFEKCPENYFYNQLTQECSCGLRKWVSFKPKE